MSDNENRPTSNGDKGKPERSFTTNNVKSTYDSNRVVSNEQRISESTQKNNSQKKKK